MPYVEEVREPTGLNTGLLVAGIAAVLLWMRPWKGGRNVW